MAFDATLGGSTANSYVDTTYADTYFAHTPYWNQWNEFSNTNREIALVQACSALETISYAGTRCDPSTNDADATSNVETNAEADTAMVVATAATPTMRLQRLIA